MALSDKTGRAVFADKVERVVRTLSEHFPNQVRPCKVGGDLESC